MEDFRLIQGCLMGSEEDFRRLMHKYTGKAMAMALNLLGNKEDAEDVCQDTFVRIYNHLESFDFNRNFKDWMYAILHNRCMDLLRKRVRFSKYAVYQSGGMNENRDEGLTTPPKAKKLPSEFLKRLSPKERTALVLWANESYSSEEIAEVLRCSASTARVFLYKARKKIKNCLEEDNALV